MLFRSSHIATRGSPGPCAALCETACSDSAAPAISCCIPRLRCTRMHSSCSLTESSAASAKLCSSSADTSLLLDCTTAVKLRRRRCHLRLVILNDFRDLLGHQLRLRHKLWDVGNRLVLNTTTTIRTGKRKRNSPWARIREQPRSLTISERIQPQSV